ncbi:MAG: ACP S-malonyltransferase [Pirellulaceae bacterium]|nr:ACP S-malonyltransferase [Pirellulaceae bacterium]
MTRTAWMFPGQGSQAAGMGRQLLAEYAHAREILDLAEQRSGLPLSELRHRGPVSELRRPSVSEPLITAISISYVEVLRSLGLSPDFIAGYSAGEVAAFYAAGVLSLEDAIEIAVIRGQLFEEFTSSDGRMVTISGVSSLAVLEVVAELSSQGQQVYLAGQNAPRHTTLVGSEADVLKAEGILSRLGAEISQVNVSGKWHSIHLAAASKLLVEKLEKFAFNTPQAPLLTSASGDFRENPDDLMHDLSIGVSQPVLWQQIIDKLSTAGVRCFCECGAGRVLFGLMRWNNEQIHEYQSICVEDRGGGLKPLKRLATKNIAE